MRFEDSFLDDIRSRVPISQVIAPRVSWDKRKTRVARGDFWACCPFHGEKGASFHCEDKKGRYHCFGCGVSGDHFRFLTEMDGIKFPRAVEIVADMAGLPMPNAAPPTAAEIAERERPDRARAAAAARQAEQAAKDKAEYVQSAGEIWKATLPLAGSLAETYLAWRGISSDSGDLRFHPGLPYPKHLADRPGLHPALVAKVTGPLGTGVGIWRIYLRADGRGKLDVDEHKVAYGHPGGGAVRLGGMAKHIGLAEGVETSIAARLLGWSMPIWAGLSTSGIIGFIIPDGVETVTVFPDRDGSKIRTREDGTVKRSPGLAAYAGFKERNPGRDIRLAPGSETDDYLETLQKVRGLPVR